MCCKQSTVFLANLEIDLTKIQSSLSYLASDIIRLNSTLRLVEVPLMPSSAYIPQNSHLSLLLIFVVYSSICAAYEVFCSLLSVETLAYAHTRLFIGTDGLSLLNCSLFLG